MKKYRLLKDLPGIHKGAIFTDEKCEDYFQGKDGGNEHHFNGCIIRENPDWFEEVQEKDFSKEDMKDFAIYYHQERVVSPLRIADELIEVWIKQR